MDEHAHETSLAPCWDVPVTGKDAPFSQELVTLTKQQHIELVMQARYWKSLHERMSGRSNTLLSELQCLRQRWQQRESELVGQLEAANALVRDLRHRLFGIKTERHSIDKTRLPRSGKSTRSRGHQRGIPGHGRTKLVHLPVREETIDIDDPKCPCCGLALEDFGSEDNEVLEIEVKAYRRLIHRRRYRCTCRCGILPGIVTPTPPARLIERGKFGVSVWVNVLLDKFLYARPTSRLLSDLGDHGLVMSAGSLTGGLHAIAPLFAPLQKSWLAKLRSEPHWHADETRWEVFAEQEGKLGHRWYLWVFQSHSVIHYVLDPTRSARVPEAALAGVEHGIISCDRYSAYRAHARRHPGIVLAFCWAHQRRDFLSLANSYPELWTWSMGWVEQIGRLYHLQGQRAQQPVHTSQFQALDTELRQAVQSMACQRDRALADSALHSAANKVLRSMLAHWAGLTVFVDQPWLPMDNNAAERAIRPAVVGRKNFYGSGSQWSGELAATMYSLLMTIQLWDLNARTWLSAYLQACAANGNRAPADVSAFVPWQMDTVQLDAMRSCAHGSRSTGPRHNDSS